MRTSSDLKEGEFITPLVDRVSYYVLVDPDPALSESALLVRQEEGKPIHQAVAIFPNREAAKAFRQYLHDAMIQMVQIMGMPAEVKEI